jgi:hypothetical protein
MGFLDQIGETEASIFWATPDGLIVTSRCNGERFN